MLDDVKALLDKASEPGDMATLLIFGTIGFVGDAALHLVGFLSPGYCGIATATAALGVKKSIDASRSRWRFKRLEEQRWREQLERALHLSKLFAETRPDLAPAVDRELRLLENRGTDVESARVALDELVKDYRQRGVAPALGGAPIQKS
jgi:hypothetical protein